MNFLGITKNNCEVYIDSENSHAATHFTDSPKLFNAVVKTIPKISLVGGESRIDFDTEEIVGTSDLVETDSNDEIIFALRLNRDRYSRFVKNKDATPTTYITLAFELIEEKKYKLYTAFIGRLTPSFPGGDYLPEQSKDFWSNHALAWGNQEVVPGTETSLCPW